MTWATIPRAPLATGPLLDRWVLERFGFALYPSLCEGVQR